MTRARLRRLLDDAAAANMNMLRVWGGGYYLPDAFYAMADRCGMLIWQDFMFGGAIPPPGRAFRANVRAEADPAGRAACATIPRSCCGAATTRCSTSWQGWGDRLAFKRRISAAQRRHIDAGMHALFGRVLRDVVARENPQVPYWPGSPWSGHGGKANATDAGDTHFWNVWSGDAAPIEAYLDVTPRFLSEYGLQSLPAMATLDAIAGNRRPLDLHAPALRAHQKYDHGRGNRRLLAYMRRELRHARQNCADFVYLSQAMQARGHPAGRRAPARLAAAQHGFAVLAAGRCVAGRCRGRAWTTTAAGRRCSTTRAVSTRRCCWPRCAAMA